MLPQDVVRIRFKAQELNTPLLVQSFGVLLAFAIVATTGCRSPFGPNSSAEPSFDRLLEIENSSTSLNTPAQSKGIYAQHQVAQHRPGGNSASSRFTEFDEDAESHSQKMASRRTLSDLDDDADDDADADADVEIQLLRQTQLALKNSAEKTAKPKQESLAADSLPPNKTSSAARKNNPKRSADDELVMRFTDKSDASSADAEPAEDAVDDSVQVEELAGSRKTKPAADGTMVRKATTEPIQPASHASSKPDRAVQPASTALNESEDSEHSSEHSLTWQQHLQKAAQQLDQSSSQQLATPQERVRQAMIARLLALSLNDREAMLQPIEGLQPHEQDYVNYQLSAIFDAVDPEANPVSSRKWSLVMLNQRKANTHLASLSNLEINNIAFCTEVIDFGVTTPFQSNKFSPDQEVLLYLELDNFVSERSKDGKSYETQLQGSYEIVDSSGRRVADQMLPADSHLCKNIRRDYFIAYRIYMPPKISPGNYTLKLTIEDLKGRKFGQADIQFQIQQ